MKTTSLRLFVVAALLPAVVFAAKDAKRPGKKSAAAAQAGPAAETMKAFDKNGNHQIDADELPAVQQAYALLKRLDKNNNGEIESSEAQEANAHASGGDRKARLMSGFARVDKNGNRRIDADEIEALQKHLAGSKVLSRIDRNSNGKLDPDELEKLNKHLEQGRAHRKGASSTPGSGEPSVRRPPESPAPATPPAEAPKTEDKAPEKKDAPAAKPPGNFGA